MRERTPQSRASMARVSSGAEQVRRSHGSWWHRAYGAESAASRSCGPAANTTDLQPLTGRWCAVSSFHVDSSPW